VKTRRCIVIAAGLWMVAASTAFAQTPPLVFTTSLPEPSESRERTTIESSAVVEERGLALWSGAASDFGVGVEVSRRDWTIRSVTSMRTLAIDRHDHPTFEQIEILRPIAASQSFSVAAGGGVRQEWDGTRVLIARALAGAQALGGRLQGSLVIERAFGPAGADRDAADLITTVGWSRRIGERFGAGVEGIGQDLEGFWNPAEAEGGARLLVGPSMHVRSRRGEWTASATVGPVLHTLSSAAVSNGAAMGRLSSGAHFGVFASANWTRNTKDTKPKS
jgi:hypothetical protein